MITHYCGTQEEVLKRAKKAAKKPGYEYRGITLSDGRKGFAVYRNGNLVERFINCLEERLITVASGCSVDTPMGDY